VTMVMNVTGESVVAADMMTRRATTATLTAHGSVPRNWSLRGSHID
jgi:hypothetical protein